jgi:hypothetical protein
MIRRQNTQMAAKVNLLQSWVSLLQQRDVGVRKLTT